MNSQIYELFQDNETPFRYKFNIGPLFFTATGTLNAIDTVKTLLVDEKIFYR